MAFDLTLMVTTACNLSCTYCYQRGEPAMDMDETLGQTAISWALDQLGPGDELSLSFFGGEPLLVFPLVERLEALATRLAGERGISLRRALVSNGILLDPTVGQWLKSRSVDLTLSLDGTQAAHDQGRVTADGRGSWLDAWAGLAGSGLDPGEITVNLVMTPGNVSLLPESVAMLHEKRLGSVSLIPEYASGWADTDLDAMDTALKRVTDWYIALLAREVPVYLGFIEEKVRRMLSPPGTPLPFCRFGRDEAAVAPDGRIFPCDRLASLKPGAPEVRGRLIPGQGWQQADPVPLLSHPPLSPEVSPDCPACRDRAWCTWFCGCANLVRTGCSTRPDRVICRFERAFLRESRRAAAILLGGAP